MMPWSAKPTLEIATSNIADDLLRANVSAGVDAIKMDVEGHEIEVLRGLGPLAKLGVTHLVTEFFPILLRANGHQEPAELITMLQAQGFMVSPVWPKMQNISDPKKFTKSVAARGTHTDLYCVHRSVQRRPTM
eukprot:2054799-Prymnesium_polylepis.2